MSTRGNRLAVAVAAGAILAAFVAWRWSTPRAPAEPAPVPNELASADAPLAAAPAPEPTPEPESRASLPLPVEPPAAPAVPAPSPAEFLASVDARFVDELGTPFSGVRLAALSVGWMKDWSPGDGALSGADGRVLLTVELPNKKDARGFFRRQLQVELVASRAGCATATRNATLRAQETAHLGTIVLATGVRVHGRTVDADGKPFANAKLGVAGAQLPGREGHMARNGSTSFERSPGATSSADGSFTIEGVAQGQRRIWAHAEGHRYAWTEAFDVPADRDVLGVELVLRPLLATDRIAGRVVDPDDAPVAHASLRYLAKVGEYGNGGQWGADAEGRFELLVDQDDSIYEITAEEINPRYMPGTVVGVKPGDHDVVIRLKPREQLAVRVLDVERNLVANAKFHVTIQGSRVEYPSTTSAPGEYSIARPPEPFTFRAVSKGFLTTYLGHPRTPLDPALLPPVLEVTLERAKLLRGRVLADGVPVPGARINLAYDSKDVSTTVAGYRSRYAGSLGQHRAPVTDADGRFELDADFDRGFWIRAEADDWAAAEVGPLDPKQLLPVNEFELVLTRGGAIEGRVLLPDGQDAEGAIVGFNHGDGFPRTLRAGPGGRFRVEGLVPGQWQVLSAKAEFNASRVEYTSIFENVPPMVWSCEVRAGETTRFDLDLTKGG